MQSVQYDFLWYGVVGFVRCPLVRCARVIDRSIRQPVNVTSCDRDDSYFEYSEIRSYVPFLPSSKV